MTEKHAWMDISAFAENDKEYWSTRYYVMLEACDDEPRFEEMAKANGMAVRAMWHEMAVLAYPVWAWHLERLEKRLDRIASQELDGGSSRVAQSLRMAIADKRAAKPARVRCSEIEARIPEVPEYES